MAFIKCTWIYSIAIVSAKKPGNKSTGTTSSMPKIYSRCLICILKVKYTEFNFPYFTTILSAYQPAVRPCSTMARASVFSHNKGNHVGFTKLLFRRTFIHCELHHSASFYP